MRALRTVSDWVMYAGMAAAMYGGAQWPRPSWPVVAGGIVIIGLGVLVRRRAGILALEEVSGLPTDARPARTGSLLDALGALRRGVDELATAAPDLPFEDIKRRAEALNWIGPERIGAAQEAIAARVGFAAYADVMTPLAAAERWLNRAWSAATDGHRPECLASLEAARAFAAEAEARGNERLAALAEAP